MYPSAYQTTRSPQPQPTAQRMLRHLKLCLFALALLLVSGIIFIHFLNNHVAIAIPEIKLSSTQYCLNIQSNDNGTNRVVDVEICRGTSAQAWAASPTTIQHPGNLCLGVFQDGTAAGSRVIASACNLSPGQVWLYDAGEFTNPNSGFCLSLPDGGTNQQLVIGSCSMNNKSNEAWQQLLPHGTNTSQCMGTKGEKVACYAVSEWAQWQSNSLDHEAMLMRYTDNTPYEAWCADFVSYVYREAGYAFTQGEADGWNENDANKIQGMGFIIHDPATYIPKSGDVAYFNYEGGHVEIVVSGGKNPTFAYGNSATVDPTTGNGQMKANTIINDGLTGQLAYYLSPI
jgi:hypothetical protein